MHKLFLFWCLNVQKTAAAGSPLPLSAGDSSPIYLMPNVFSAHPSSRKVNDWLPRTAPHNNRLCMGRKLSNSQNPVAKNSSNQNPCDLLHRAFVSWCGGLNMCEGLRIREKCRKWETRGAKRANIWQSKRMTDRPTDSINGCLVVWLIEWMIDSLTTSCLHGARSIKQHCSKKHHGGRLCLRVFLAFSRKIKLLTPKRTMATPL